MSILALTGRISALFAVGSIERKLDTIRRPYENFELEFDRTPGRPQAVKLWWGRKGVFCTGAGICIIRPDPGPGCPIDPLLRLPENVGDRFVRALATPAKDRIEIELTEPPPDRSARISIDENIVLDSCNSEAIGYQSLTILAGVYQVDRRGSRFGKLTLKISGDSRLLPPVTTR